MIAEDAIASVDDGAIRGAGHIASAPGEPPNSNTGALVDSIRAGEVVATESGVQTSVAVGAEHGLYLERGTSKMLARPFLEPAAERHRSEIVEAVGKRFGELLRS